MYKETPFIGQGVGVGTGDDVGVCEPTPSAHIYFSLGTNTRHERLT